MVKVRKGILFTLSIFLIMSLILTLTVLMYRNTQKNEKRLLELGSMERVYDIDSSVQQGLKNIFYDQTDINLGINDRKVYFEENFPHEEGWWKGMWEWVHCIFFGRCPFQEQIDEFEAYIEDQGPEDIELDLGAVKESLPLVIKPHSITYKHLPYPGNKIEVLPEELNFNKYQVWIRTDQEVNTENCEFPTAAEGGDFWAEIDVDSKGTGCYFNNIIDPCQTNTFTIIENQSHVSNREIDIKIGSPETCGKLSLEYEYKETWPALDDTVRVTLTVNETKNETIKITYPNNIIGINITDLGISKLGTVRIL